MQSLSLRTAHRFRRRSVISAASRNCVTRSMTTSVWRIPDGSLSPKATWGELARLHIRGQGVFRQLGFRAPQLQSGAHPGDSSLRFWPACNWAAWHDQQDQARSGCLKSGINRRHSEAIHKSVSSPHRRNTRRPTLNIAAIYNNLIAYNLISVAVWVCGRIDLEKSK